LDSPLPSRSTTIAVRNTLCRQMMTMVSSVFRRDESRADAGATPGAGIAFPAGDSSVSLYDGGP
jgi:hypothetical protein